jgi:hypothetical protein
MSRLQSRRASLREVKAFDQLQEIPESGVDGTPIGALRKLQGGSNAPLQLLKAESTPVTPEDGLSDHIRLGNAIEHKQNRVSVSPQTADGRATPSERLKADTSGRLADADTFSELLLHLTESQATAKRAEERELAFRAMLLAVEGRLDGRLTSLKALAETVSTQAFSD